MSGTLTAIIGAIETILTSSGFVKAADAFDFDAVPSSVIHKAYRIESRILQNRYGLDNLSNPLEEIAIWIAYKTFRDPVAARNTAYDDRETIESAIVTSAAIQALASSPILELNGEASATKLLEDILVSKLVFTADYLRTL